MKRGRPFNARTVREILDNTAYAGDKGYPALIEPERWQAIQDHRRRMDPAAVQRRKGGRRPGDPSYWLRGLLFCLDCGASLYTRPLAAGRTYTCANVRTSTGLCDAEGILAEPIEGHVLAHVEAFVGDAEKWLADQAEQRDDGRQQLLETARRLRAEREQIDRRRERLLDDYEALGPDDAGGRLLLGRASRLEAEGQELTAKIADAEAIAAEWENADDADLAEAVDLLRALQEADTAQALNAALGRALAGIYVRVRDGVLRAEFELAGDLFPDRRAAVHLFQHAQPADPAGTRITLDGPAKPGATPSSTSRFGAGLALPPLTVPLADTGIDDVVRVLQVVFRNLRRMLEAAASASSSQITQEAARLPLRAVRRGRSPDRDGPAADLLPELFDVDRQASPGAGCVDVGLNPTRPSFAGKDAYWGPSIRVRRAAS